MRLSIPQHWPHCLPSLGVGSSYTIVETVAISTTHSVKSRLTFDPQLASQARLLAEIASGWSGLFGRVRVALASYDSHRCPTTTLRSSRLGVVRTAILRFFQLTPSVRSHDDIVVEIGFGVTLLKSSPVPHRDIVSRGRLEDEEEDATKMYDALLHTLAHRVVDTYRSGKELPAVELQYLPNYSLFLCYLLESDKALIDASVERDKIPDFYMGTLLGRESNPDDFLPLAYDAVVEATGCALGIRFSYCPTLTALMEQLKKLESPGWSEAKRANVWNAVDDYVSGCLIPICPYWLMTSRIGFIAQWQRLHRLGGTFGKEQPTNTAS